MEHYRNQHNTLKRSLWRAYIIGLHLLIAVLIFKTDFIPKFEAKFFASPTTSNLHGERMIAYHQAMDMSVPVGAAIFLGDSITQGLATAAVAPLPVNYGIGLATTSELLSNLPKYQSLKHASVVFLMIGINDLEQGKTEGLATRLNAIVAAIPNDLPLVWSGIMPTYSETIDSAQVEYANNIIKELCAARNRCTYVNTAEIFSVGGANWFRDGVHPNDQGYAKWITALRKAYQDLMQQKLNGSFKPTHLRGAT
jgi:lysophospholipase L1-like esterase